MSYTKSTDRTLLLDVFSTKTSISRFSVTTDQLKLEVSSINGTKSKLRIIYTCNFLPARTIRDTKLFCWAQPFYWSICILKAQNGSQASDVSANLIQFPLYLHHNYTNKSFQRAKERFGCEYNASDYLHKYNADKSMIGAIIMSRCQKYRYPTYR
jgi:hypothetical protein